AVPTGGDRLGPELPGRARVPRDRPRRGPRDRPRRLRVLPPWLGGCANADPRHRLSATHSVDLTPIWCHTGTMNLTPYVENLRQALAAAAETGGDETLAAAQRLTAPLEPAVRLMLLEALSSAADEITRELAPGSVELRLHAGEPDFVVTSPPAQHHDPEPPALAPPS